MGITLRKSTENLLTDSLDDAKGVVLGIAVLAGLALVIAGIALVVAVRHA